MYRTQIEAYKISANIILVLGIVSLYLVYGSLAMLYLGGAVQVLILTTQLFFDKLPDAMEYLYVIRQKKGFIRNTKNILPVSIIYSVVACVLAIGILYVMKEVIFQDAQHIYAGNLIKNVAVLIPLIATIQVLRGVLQIRYSPVVTGMTYLVQAILVVLLVRFGLGSSVEYGEKVAALLQSEHVVYLYIGERIMLYYGIVTALLSVVSIILLLLQPKTTVKILDYKAQDGRETKKSIMLKLMKFIIPNGIVSASVLIPLLLLYKIGMDQISTGNRLMGHFYGFMLPSVLAISLLSKMTFDKLDATCSKELRKKEVHTRNHALKLLITYAVFVGAFAYIVLIPSAGRILSLLGFQRDVAVTQFYFATIMIVGLIIPVTCATKILFAIGKQFSVVLVYAVTTGLVTTIAYFTANQKNINYLHIIGTLVMYFVILTILLFILLFDRLKLSLHTLLPYMISILLCATTTTTIFYFISNWIVSTLGGLFAIVTNVVIGGLIYSALVAFFYVFTKEQAKSLPLGKIYIELLELMGR